MQTPQENAPELANAIGIPALYLKREDLHHFGSHKGRSIPLMIETYVSRGVRDFVISSSGNAALAAAHALPDGCKITIFVGKKINDEKLQQLRYAMGDKRYITIDQVANPKQRAFQMEKDGRAKNLRQSTDDAALAGYESLAEELKKIPNLQAGFIPTSSGTTAIALAQYLSGVQIHIVQTEAVHPIAEQFDKTFTRQNMSEARAIVDKVAHRKDAVVAAVRASGGSGWIVSDEQINDAMKLVKETAGKIISPNSALAVAGLQKALQNGWTPTGAVVCLLTGA